MSQLEQYAALHSMLHSMERDLGLKNLTAAEKAVLSAVTQLQGVLNDTEFVSSRAIKNHDLCAHLPNPTFFRALGASVGAAVYLSSRWALERALSAAIIRGMHRALPLWKRTRPRCAR